MMALTILLIFTANLWSQLKIMPLGDSITKGELMVLSENKPNPGYIADKALGYHISGAGGTLDEGNGGYRSYLSEMLQLLGWDFQLVGELSDAAGAHEGHDGFMSSDLLNGLPQILTANNPDVVLLHIGTNDLPTPINADSCYANIRSMVQEIEIFNPSTQVFVARIIPCLINIPLAVDRYPEIERLNTLLNALPNEFQTVKLVDMWAAFINTPNWETELMSDTWHPNEAGYSFMAEIWRNKLTETIDGTVPEITGVSPDTGLSENAEFTCTVTGSHFQAATTLYLQGTLGQLLPASQVTVTNAATLTATFDLSQATAGEWIVTARNPNQMRSIHTTDVVLHVTNSTSSGGYTQRVNAGGSNYVDSDGQSWSADQSYSDGSFGYVGGNTYRTYDTISGTTNDIVYQTERWGLTAYRFSVPNGNYQVKLHFAEIYLEAANKRVIDVSLEGAPALTSLDIFAEVGHDAALIKILNTIAVSDGILDIEFFRDVEDPKISGIEVIAQSTEPTLYVNTDGVNFGAFSEQETISLMNIGSGELSWSIADIHNTQWLTTIFPADGVLTAGQNQQIILETDRSPLSVGDYPTTLSITSNGGEKSLNITLRVPAAAHLNVSPQALDLTAQQSSGTFIISNSGEDSLRWSASQSSPVNWISNILPAQGVVAGGGQQTVSVTVNRTGLSDGSYASSVEIAAAEALNSPQTLSLTMQVSDDVQQIPQFESWETELVSTTSYDHPFLAVELAAVFTTPSGKTVTINGFWAGGNTWKIRFMPEEIGNYTYTTASTEASLHQQTGSFACTSSSHPGKLVVDQAHPHTFSYSRGGHFFWFGETSWLMMSDGAPYESIFKPYVDQRVSQNFNAIHFVLGTGGLPVGTSNPQNEGGYLWLVQNKEINPAFFDWMDLRMDYLHEKQMAVGFFITWAQHFAQFSRAEYERFENYLMARYAAYPLLYWVVVGEFDEASDVGEYNYHGSLLDQADAYDHLVSNHPGHSDPDNIGSSRIFANQDWFKILIQQYPKRPGELSPTAINAEVVRDRVYNMPVVNIEYGYEENTYLDRLFTADDVRQHAWAIMVGGGFFSYGHWESIRDIDLNYLDSPGVTYLQYLRDFFIDLDWWEMAPDNDRVSQGFCLAQAGEEYVIYLPNGGGVTVNLPGGDLFTANWLNPRTGSSINSSAMLAGSYKSYYPPFSG
ncbi:DUF4038 domain-containing protein, partial [bacterium]|nr:DUF4038 domain-containing protein [bacterium]